MALMIATLGFVLKRAWYRRAILLPVALGVLSMATVLCSVPLFSSAATEAALQAALHAPNPAVANNLEIRITAMPLASTAYQRLSAATTTNAQSTLGSDLVNQAPIRVGSTNLLVYPPADTQHRARRPLNSADLWFFSSMSSAHMLLTQGRFPSPAVAPQDTDQGTAYNVEAIIDPAWANVYHLKLNDVLDLAAQIGQTPRFLRVHITGFFKPRSLSDPAWFDDLDAFSDPISFNQEPLPPVPIVLSEGAFENALPNLQLSAPASYIWFYYLNLDAITPASLSGLQDHLLALRNSFRLPDISLPGQPLSYDVLSQLNEIIQGFLQQLFFVTVVTLVAILPGIALLLLYLGATGGTLVDQSREEVALMKSRGASPWQMFALFLGEMLLLCTAVLLIAPLLAAQITILLAKLAFFTLPLSRLTAALAAPTLQVYLYAGVAVSLAFLALLISTTGAARTHLLAVKQQISRPRLRALALRLGPGLLLVALGAFGYLHIRQHGAFFLQSLQGQNLQGDPVVDWVAAASPTLLLLGVSGLGLLLIPPVLALLNRLGRRLFGITAHLALRQMAGRPALYSRLILLLALTISLGLFTALFNASFASNFAERAAYLAGADLRLAEGADYLPDYARQAVSLQDHLALLPGVTDGMNAFRTSNQINAPALNFAFATTLAVDTHNFARLAFWRADFADVPLAALMQTLQRPVAQEDSVPALVDDQLLHDTGARVGDQLDIQIGANNGVNFVIVGAYHYFPTLDTSQYNMVCDMNLLFAALNRGLSHPAPNEVWLKLAPTAPIYTAAQVEQRLLHNPEQKQIITSVIEAYDRRALADALRNDPLHRSVSSALALDFVIATLLSLVGFVFFFYLIARQRAFEFGVLRALGLSARQLIGSLGWEQVTLLLLALALGAPLGYIVANVALPPLSTDDSGTPLLPPLAAHLNAAALIAQGVFLFACIGVALAAILFIFRRLHVQEVVRLGEE